MNKPPRLYADFNKAAGPNTVILTCARTLAEMTTLSLDPREGQKVLLYMPDVDDEGKSDPLEVEAVLRWDKKYACWLADFDWKQLDHVSRTKPNTSGSTLDKVNDQPRSQRP